MRTTISFVLLMVFAAPTPVAQAQEPPGAPGISSAAAILVDLDDADRILFQRDIHSPRGIASLTKVVTALVARDQYQLDEVVTADRWVYTTEGSSMGLRPGMRFTVGQLLNVLLLKSANDAAAAIAAHHPLGYRHFISLMNEKARALGADGSGFRNPHGLDDAGHLSTAWDMALFGRQLLADPFLSSIVKKPEYSLRWGDGTNRRYLNHNKLIRQHEGTIGLKTGFTAKAGHSLISAHEGPFGRFLTVVIDSKDHYADTKALFGYGATITSFVETGGGGAELPDAFLLLPPRPPTDGLAPQALPAALSADPRNSVWWTAAMAALVMLSLATLGWRRRDPILEAADAVDI